MNVSVHGVARAALNRLPETLSMTEDNASPQPTIALSTKVEEDFVAPLAAVRGAHGFSP